MRSRLELLFGLIKESVVGMSEDRVPMMGAALAYYMMFSIAPLLVIAIGAAGVVFGRRAGADVFGSIARALGPEAAGGIRSLVKAAASRPHAGAIATVVAVVTTLVGASGVFQQLQQSMNIIWKVAVKPGAAWKGLLRQRLLSFGMVLLMGLLVSVLLAVSAAISAAGVWVVGVLPGVRLLWRAVDVLISFAILSGLFAAALKLLPDVRLAWKDVRAGGALTAFLFVLGKTAIGAYVGGRAFSSAYGAAASLIVVMIWVFLASQMLYFGAEFTRALFLRKGGAPQPKAGATLAVRPFAAAANRRARSPRRGRFAKRGSSRSSSPARTDFPR